MTAMQTTNGEWMTNVQDGAEDQADGNEEGDDDESANEDLLVEGHVVEASYDQHCRDDALIDCDKILEEGLCNVEHKHDLISYRDLCPVTCGVCTAPPTNLVWLDYNCYQHAEDITVYFANAMPDKEDYVGIFPAYADVKTNPDLLFDDALMWFYCCGSMEEFCRTMHGGLIFGSMGPSEHEKWTEFPLQAGTYKAVLARGKNNTLLAESAVFSVKPEGQSCYHDCKDMVFADSTCYVYEDGTINITFENCKPIDNDRVAIYPEGVRAGSEEPDLWVGTCGNQTCTGKVVTEVLSFGPAGPETSGAARWPLAPGTYRAYLMRMTEGGFGNPAAESASFTINHGGEPCFHDTEDL